MDPSQNPNVFHATTILSVRRNGRVAVESLNIAGDICIYTNRNVVVEEL